MAKSSADLKKEAATLRAKLAAVQKEARKMKRLEDMYQRNLFRPVFIAGKKYYFIPKQLIL